MGLPKCKECVSCMHPIWVDNNRYFYCDLCRLYYAGQTAALYVVPNPYLVDCKTCGGTGYILSSPVVMYITREMALDAGDINLEGTPFNTQSYEDVDLCPECNGNKKIDGRLYGNNK